MGSYSTTNIVYGDDGNSSYTGSASVTAYLDAGGTDSLYISNTDYDPVVVGIVDKKHLILKGNTFDSSKAKYEIILNWFDGNGNTGTGCIETIRYQTHGFLATTETITSKTINSYISKGYYVNLKYYGSFSEVFQNEYGAQLDQDAALEKYEKSVISSKHLLGFNEEYYLSHNTDVAAVAGTSATDKSFLNGETHYLLSGQFEGRSPNAAYDETYYFAHNPELVAPLKRMHMSGYEHYVKYGQYEGRAASASFTAAGYLKANPDVAEAIADGIWKGTAYEHYAMYGQFENRSMS